MTRIALSDAEFAAVASLLHDAAGLTFDESRRDSLSFCIAERMTSVEAPDVAAYLAVLAGADGATERQALLDEVTIPETHFFRNPPQVRALRKYVLPELLRQASAGQEAPDLERRLLDRRRGLHRRDPDPRAAAAARRLGHQDPRH